MTVMGYFTLYLFFRYSAVHEFVDGAHSNVWDIFMQLPTMVTLNSETLVNLYITNYLKNNVTASLWPQGLLFYVCFFTRNF